MSTIETYYAAGDKNFETNEMGYKKAIMMSFSSAAYPSRQSTELVSSKLTLYYIKNGNGVIEIGGEKVPVAAHDVVMIDRVKPYRLYSEIVNMPLEAYQFKITNFKIAGYEPDCVSADGFIVFSYRSPDNPVLVHIKNIIKTFEEKAYSFHTKADSYFSVMILDLIQAFMSIPEFTQKAQAPPYTQTMAEVKRRLDTDFLQDIDLKALAKQYNLTKRELLQQFKDIYFLPVTKYLDGLRLEPAKRQIDLGRKDFDAIAKEAGFPDTLYFMRVFKRSTGVTLGAYLAFKQERNL